MKTSTILTSQNNFSRTRVIVLIILLILSSIGMFGQNSNQVISTEVICNDEIIVSNDIPAPTVQNNTAVINSDLNFVSWFMGTKQAPNVKIINNPQQNCKRQIINSGIAPNGLLLKVFLKKAISYHSAVA